MFKKIIEQQIAWYPNACEKFVDSIIIYDEIPFNNLSPVQLHLQTLILIFLNIKIN